MTRAPKPTMEQVFVSCMADLGRQRQEELPLNNEQRGCSYDPNSLRGPRYKKVSVQKAKATSSAWANCTIQDEETEQMEGLELSECPWRPNNPPTHMSARHHDFYPSSNTNGNSVSGRSRTARSLPPPVLQDNTTAFALMQKEAQRRPKPDLEPKPEPKLEQEPEPQPEQPQPEAGISIPPTGRGDSAQCDQGSTHGNAIPPTKPSLTACVFQNGEQFNGEDNQTAYFGTFMNYPGEGSSEKRFLVEFEIKVQLSPCSAWLLLNAKGRGKREHDISLLDAPQMVNQFCILTIKGSPKATYCLELDNLKATKLFSECVYKTQKWLEHVRENVITEAESTEPSSKPQEISSVDERDRIKVKNETNTQEKELGKNHAEEVNKTKNVPESTPKVEQEEKMVPNGVSEQEKASSASQEATCLINIVESLPPKASEKKVSKSAAYICTEEAFDGLWVAAGALFSTMVSAGESQRNRLHAEIEEALNAKWEESKIPEAYGEVKAAFLANLSSFIDMRFDLIKQVIQLANQSSNQDIPESMKEFLKPICYNPGDLTNLRSRATDCPEEIKKAKFLPEKGAGKTPSTPTGERYLANREAPNPSKLRSLWSAAPSATKSAPPTQAASATVSDSRPAEQQTTQGSEAPPSATGGSYKVATMKARPLGLSSSMYANK